MARGRRRIISTRGGRGGTGGGALLFLLVAAGAVVVWVVWAIVSAVIAAFSTPYPWIALALAGLGYAGYRLAGIVRRERLEALFFDAVAALHDGDPRAPELLGRLEHRGRDEADAMLLVAAGAASRGQIQEALAALDRASALAGGIGRISGGLPLDFPGLPATLWFFPDGWGSGGLEVARAQLRVLAGQARLAVENLKLSAMDPAYALGMSTLAEAHVALRDPWRAAEALKEALRAKELDADIACGLRYRLARLLEQQGDMAAAWREYRALVAAGGHEDAAERLAAVEDAAAEERRRKAEARRQEEEAQAAAEEQRRAAEAQRLQREAELREEELLRQALDRLEGAKGAAGRRAALSWGLDRLTIPAMRQRLMVDASRVEVEAVLDKVDGLKTAAAKRRHLGAALEALRADEIPDELQAQQIRWLEEALAALEE